MKQVRWLFAAFVAAATASTPLAAQEPATVTGRVTNAAGAPESAVTVRINALTVGTTTAPDGTYSLVIPASRLRGSQQVTITASRVGLSSSSRTITLSPGIALTQNFQLGADVLQLEGIVATGQGTTTTRERATTAINSVRAQEITQSRETNVVSALAGKAPNVLVSSTSGDPGAGAYIQIRGAASVEGGTQPLFVVDGTQIDNGSYNFGGESNTAGTVLTNRAADINPADIERVEILKGAAATALYGAQGANGVVLITTKSGRSGATRATFTSQYSSDDVNKVHPLQRQYSQGLDGDAVNPATGLPVAPGQLLSPFNRTSWGRLLPEGTETYDHAREMYRRGNRLENTMTVSGGTERTTYFLSLGRLDQQGVVVGPQGYDRTSVRLKATQMLRNDLRMGGNLAYTRSGGDFVQTGSNLSGIQLGALRTPPEYNNCPTDNGFNCHRNPLGFHHAYRGQGITSINQAPIYDNPFWVANELTNSSEVDRSFGNVNLEYTPASWLRVNYILGADFSADDRLQIFPKQTASQSVGQITRATFTNRIIDSNLTATANWNLGEAVVGSTTLGQSLQQSNFARNQTTGVGLILGAEQTDYSVSRTGDEYRYQTRNDGYFGTTQVTFADQLTLNATGRFDGSSTFGGEGKRFFYPGVGAAWTFSRLPVFDNASFLDQGKLRVSFGVSGREPPVYSNVTGFNVGTFDDSYVTDGLSSTYLGNEGVFTNTTLGNTNIRPERKSELEGGFDLAFLDNRVGFGFTYYTRRTTDAILAVPVAASTGFEFKYENAAEFDNSGIEMTLDLQPVRARNFTWSVNANWAKNESCVKNLAGAEHLFLAGFSGGNAVEVVGPDHQDPLNPGCRPFGLIFGSDFVRFGRGIQLNGVNIDEQFKGTPGALYIGANGFPVADPDYRILGDPNPDWTAGIRNSVQIGQHLTISGLVDVKHGGDMWNGTRGALYTFGTHEETLAWRGAGKDTSWVGGAGPGCPNGVCKTVKLNRFWGNGVGGGFEGPTSQFVEDAGFVKLRDVSVGYSFTQPWVRRLGTSAVDVTVSGRNLKTWTDYRGLDPESNLTGQSTGRGIDYFNNPQTRSYVVTVNLTR
jgi:TonB-linked SusC/RagA family outer membrane protein